MEASTATQAIRISARLPNTRTCHEGTLLNASREGLVVRLDTGEALRALREGASLLVTINSAEAAYELMTQVRYIDGTVLNLQIVSPPKRLDRRRNRRYPVNLPVVLTPIKPAESADSDEPEALQARGVNISRSGMRLIVPEAFPVGAVVELSFSLLNAEQPVRAKAEVRYARELSSGQWAIGVRFTEMARTDAHWLVRLFP